MEDYNIQLVKYKDCDKSLRTSILNTLFTSFDKNLDPCLYDESILQLLYYKKYLVGMICGIDNFELLRFNSPKGYIIKNNKKGMFIYNLCIKPFFRKRGFGKILLKLFLNTYKDESDYFHVQIFAKNTPSLNIFNSCNFKEQKRMKTNGEEEFILLSR
jgi:ribosomal protein S18 acetylase RimI-like enzyme